LKRWLRTLFMHFSKALLRNKSLWGWGVLFMFFWLFLGAFVESNSLPKNALLTLSPSTSSWYSVISMFSLSTLGISISFSLIYATHSLAYSFRYTKLRPMTYLTNLGAASGIVGVTLGVIMLLSTYALFSYKFGVNLAPANPVLAVIVAAVTGVFMYALGMFLVLLLINFLGLKNESFVSFVPLILAYGFGFTQLYAKLPASLLYASPYNAIQGLMFHAYSGQPIPQEFTASNGLTLEPLTLGVSLVAWIALLILLDSVMLRRIKPREIEEARQV
jgi:hypothetical protein